MEDERFNPATYMVIDRITGEEIPIQIFVEHTSSKYWEKAYAKTLAEYIGITGTSANKLLAYFIKEKDSKNRIIGTVRNIAKEVSVSEGSAVKVFRLLREKKFLKKVNNGCYMLSPTLLVHGSKTHGAMLLRIWGEIC